MASSRAVIAVGIAVAAMMASCTAMSPDHDESPSRGESVSYDGFGECRPEDRLVGEGEHAAGQALTCITTVDVDGVEYYLHACFAVDGPLLGPVVARSENYVARSIKGAGQLALAFRRLDTDVGFNCEGWHGWHVYSRLANTNAEERIVGKLICRVHPPGKPVDPRFCRRYGASDAANVSVH